MKKEKKEKEKKEKEKKKKKDKKKKKKKKGEEEEKKKGDGDEEKKEDGYYRHVINMFEGHRYLGDDPIIEWIYHFNIWGEELEREDIRRCYIWEMFSKPLLPTSKVIVFSIYN